MAWLRTVRDGLINMAHLENIVIEKHRVSAVDDDHIYKVVAYISTAAIGANADPDKIEQIPYILANGITKDRANEVITTIMDGIARGYKIIDLREFYPLLNVREE